MKENSHLRRPTFHYCQNHPLNSLLFHFYAPEDVHRSHCSNVPTVIIKQLTPDSLGRHGRMALCSDCLPAIKAALRQDFYTVEEIPSYIQEKAERRADRLRRNLTIKQVKAEQAGTPLIPAVGSDLRLSHDRPRTTSRNIRSPTAPQDDDDDFSNLR